MGYAIALDPRWLTLRAHVQGRSRAGDRSVTLAADGSGRWAVDGAARPELDGCLDVDLESSALTNAFPVRRLGLAVGRWPPCRPPGCAPRPRGRAARAALPAAARRGRAPVLRVRGARARLQLPARVRRARDDPRLPRPGHAAGLTVRAIVLDAPGRPLRRAEPPVPGRATASCCCGCARAASAAPTCTCSTARCAPASCRVVLGHQIVGDRRGHRRARRRPVARLDLRRVPLLPVGPREPVRRARASPAATSTAASPSTPSPTRASASRSRDGYPDLQAAPLLCAGLIGYRALRMAGDARAARAVRLRRGGAHHLPGRAPRGPARVRVHARRRRHARSSRAGSARSGPAASGDAPPEALDAAIIFAPVGRARAGRAARGGQGRDRRLRAAST